LYKSDKIIDPGKGFSLCRDIGNGNFLN